ncbi:MAG: glycosyltransferase family 2 protein, partial [Moraxella sp.]
MSNCISVLVPVFNESENIRNCINNLSKQSSQNFEIIFVDDGSTDDSWAILNQIIKDYPKMDIQILQQKNQGIAAARFLAAKHAKYEYVLIHDCDDKISNNSIELLLKDLYTDSEIDAVLLSLKIQYKDDNNNLAYSDFKYEDDRLILTGKECFLGTIDHWKIHNLACQKKANFLKAYELYTNYNKNLENYGNNDEIVAKLQWIFCRKVIKSDAIYYYQYNEKS